MRAEDGWRYFLYGWAPHRSGVCGLAFDRADFARPTIRSDWLR